MASNLWGSLPPSGSPSYVLPADQPYVTYFNRFAAPEHFIVTNQVPEPWLGPVCCACLFVLQLNPRYLVGAPPNLIKHPSIGKTNLAHYGLASGDKWWMSCFKALARDIGQILQPGALINEQLNAGYKHLEGRVCSIEYFPYGSKKFAHSLLRLPSQDYSFDLVRYGISRNVNIVALKGAKEWRGAVPKLDNYQNFSVLKGFRGAKYITPSTCGGNARYKQILDSLLQCKGECHCNQLPADLGVIENLAK